MAKVYADALKLPDCRQPDAGVDQCPRLHLATLTKDDVQPQNPVPEPLSSSGIKVSI